MLYGRDTHAAAIARLLAEAQAGVSAAMVVRGEPGIGKSALLDHAAQLAGAGTRVLRSVGVETEAELPFAALHLLLRPALRRLDSLPTPQAAALRSAFGLEQATGTDRFLVGLATLSLLSELAEDGPLLCLIDDAQWLDQASADALLFTARRLQAEGIVMLIAARDDRHAFPAQGLPELPVEALDRESVRQLLAATAPELDPALLERAIAETNGNPLALLELPKAAAAHGDAHLHLAALPLTRRVQDAFAAQIDLLPPQAQQLLLVVAAENTGDLALILQGAQLLGIPADALDFAERAHLVTVLNGRVTFRHPLVRSATYHSAGYAQRRAVHLALAEVADDDRRAWHRAAPATGHDEEIALELDRSAERARARNAYAAMAAAYERAAQLSADHQTKANRLTAAAQATVDIGQYARAAQLSERAAALTTDAMTTARLARVQAAVEFERGISESAAQILIAGARRVAEQNPVMAGEMLVAAADNAWGQPAELNEASQLLDSLVLPPDSRLRPFIPAMRGLARVATKDVAGGYPMLRDFADQALNLPGPSTAEQFWASQLLLVAGKISIADEMAGALVASIRREGQIGLLPAALDHRSYAQMLLGRYRDAAANCAEGLKIADDIGQGHAAASLRTNLAWIAAIQGDEEQCRTMAAVGIEATDGHRSPTSGLNGTWALALLDLGLGRYQSALDRMSNRFRGLSHVSTRCIADEVEAAVRAGQTDSVREPLAHFAQWAAQSGEAWAGAMVARCHALLGEDEEQYLLAIRLHEVSIQPYEQARTRLAYGEYLRRQRRKTDARTQLHSALEAFERLGARPWADRALLELRATGDTSAAHVRPDDRLGALTAQELQVVRLAAAGATNRDIAAQMFLSPRTVGQHLYKAFPKLGVTSRVELARLPLGGD